MEYRIGERNLARNTQRSYRDTLALRLPFTAASVGTPVDRLVIDDLSSERVRAFLHHLEAARGCALSTRNQRLAALHALAHFIGHHRPEPIAWTAQIRGIPFKKTTLAVMASLDKAEMDALLQVPDRRTAQGRRDSALLLCLYNSGGRADEVARLPIADLDLGPSGSGKFVGKGNKVRRCPRWPLTIQSLAPLVTGRGPTEPVFLNRRKHPITRFGIPALVKRTVRHASTHAPSLRAKRVSPHTIRHTTAVHLLRAGVDLNTIRAWLGHVSLDTTHAYAEIDLEMKAKALACCEIPAPAGGRKPWREDRGLLAFLRSL